MNDARTGQRRFAARAAIVTGGAKGIGRATTMRLLAEGARVAVLDREDEDSRWADALRRDAGAAGDRLLYLCGDATDEAAIAAAAGRAASEHGPADILVNNAGFGANPRPIEETSREEWDGFMAANVTSAFLVSRAILPAMRAKGYGRIVNLASVAGRSVSEISNLHYSTAKAAIMGFTRKLAFEEAANGITVNAVAPGTVYTERIKARYEALAPDDLARRMAAIPMGRAARPEEIAAAILFLASDDASYITGVVLDVNGGKLMA